MRRTIACVLIGLLLLLGIVIILDLFFLHKAKAQARKIQSGFTKHQVRSILGRPVTVFKPPAQAATNLIAAMLSVTSETWAYGSHFDFKDPFVSDFPFIFPFRLRLFRPSSEDVVIEFDRADRVNRVTIPK